MARMQFCVLIALTTWSCTHDTTIVADDSSADPTGDTFTEEVEDTTSDTWDVTPDPEPEPPVDTVDTHPEFICGDGFVWGLERCDGDVAPCMVVDPGYVTGYASCLPDCSGFDESECVTFEQMAERIQRAAQITGEAQMALMGLDLVGLYEWEIKQIITQVFIDNGADAELAFPHIVASGPNALELHYAGDDRMVEDGDLLLVDIGAKSMGYCGDITRTIPANGVFTDRQRELYQLVLDAQSAVATEMRPGVHSLDDMYFFTQEIFRASPLRALNEYGVEQTMDIFFIHHISHYIGTMVHAEDLLLDPGQPAELGHVFSIEPGLYIESEGIGIRIEDDYILTADGAVNLAPGTPKTIEAIEAMMAAP